ncbi:hypothetical protein BDY24DRAFT_112193 [Mrakia frigida]|uniref:uncharacterized protein n=1 Tax=Mrakia frigida TaxID=29902 RepID=UPI003FCC1755
MALLEGRGAESNFSLISQDEARVHSRSLVGRRPTYKVTLPSLRPTHSQPSARPSKPVPTSRIKSDSRVALPKAVHPLSMVSFLLNLARLQSRGREQATKCVTDLFVSLPSQLPLLPNVPSPLSNSSMDVNPPQSSPSDPASPAKRTFEEAELEDEPVEEEDASDESSSQEAELEVLIPVRRERTRVRIRQRTVVPVSASSPSPSSSSSWKPSN